MGGPLKQQGTMQYHFYWECEDIAVNCFVHLEHTHMEVFSCDEPEEFLNQIKGVLLGTSC